MTDITTPAQMREAAARCCEAEADKCDDAAKWGGSKRYVSDCKAAAYAMRDLAAAIRALPVADPLCTWPSCGHTAKGQCRTYTSGQLIAPNDASITATNIPVAEPEPLAVKVKPLVWVREDGRSEEHPKWTADVDAKRYEVFTAWWGDQDKWGFVALGQFYHTEADAIAAAEADHAARILSQIDAVPAAQIRAEALEEAAALPPYDCDGDPAGSFDHHVFVKRDAIRALIEKENFYLYLCAR